MGNDLIKFRCDECNTEGSYSYSDINYEEQTNEGGMGSRIEYWGNAETDCAHCGTSIVITHNFTQYPVDNFEDGELQLSGASRI